MHIHTRTIFFLLTFSYQGLLKVGPCKSLKGGQFNILKSYAKCCKDVHFPNRNHQVSNYSIYYNSKIVQNHQEVHLISLLPWLGSVASRPAPETSPECCVWINQSHSKGRAELRKRTSVPGVSFVIHSACAWGSIMGNCQKQPIQSHRLSL